MQYCLISPMPSVLNCTRLVLGKEEKAQESQHSVCLTSGQLFHLSRRESVGKDSEKKMAEMIMPSPCGLWRIRCLFLEEASSPKLLTRVTSWLRLAGHGHSP